MSRFNSMRKKTARARNLRSDMTDAERKLWRQLRRKSIVGLRFRRRHPIGPYILDFYFPELKLCVEVDGGQHGENKEIVRDINRTAHLEAKGVTVIRFWNNDVFENLEGVLESIFDQAMNMRREAEIDCDAIPSPWKGEG